MAGAEPLGFRAAPRRADGTPGRDVPPAPSTAPGSRPPTLEFGHPRHHDGQEEHQVSAPEHEPRHEQPPRRAATEPGGSSSTGIRQSGPSFGTGWHVFETGYRASPAVSLIRAYTRQGTVDARNCPEDLPCRIASRLTIIVSRTGARYGRETTLPRRSAAYGFEAIREAGKDAVLVQDNRKLVLQTLASA